MAIFLKRLRPVPKQTIEIIFICCKVCDFITPNYARLTTINFEKTKFILFGNRTNAASFCGKMPP